MAKKVIKTNGKYTKLLPNGKLYSDKTLKEVMMKYLKTPEGSIEHDRL